MFTIIVHYSLFIFNLCATYGGETMIISGWHKTSLIDYPGKVASTIFTPGCNFRCPYCHNSDLVFNDSSLSEFSEDDVLKHLEKRKKLY